MTHTPRVPLGFCLLLAFAMAAGWQGAPVRAQESTAAPAPALLGETLFAGVPVYSVMKTDTASLTLSATPVNAFTPIAIPCPATAGAAGCTFRVTVSAQFAEISAVNVVRMNLIISGAGTTGPDPLLNVASNSSPSWPQMYTAQWVRKNIPAGSTPTITLQFVMDATFGFGGFRTISIDVMNGLL